MQIVSGRVFAMKKSAWVSSSPGPQLLLKFDTTALQN
jgi:hypothetical protein